MRRFDWSRTPLGSPQSWSPALRTTLRILLANRFPHILWWGPSYIQFYNDAYQPIPGAKHPDQVLGQRASDCWQEIWPIIGPLIDRPFTGGPATWDDDICLVIRRHGFMEESHFTIAYSPVPDETVPSGIGGVLATVHEITEKVVAQRRVVALRDLGARTSDAKSVEEACTIAAQAMAAHEKDVPFMLLYLVDSGLTAARLVAATGVNHGEEISPAEADLRVDSDCGWPLAAALHGNDIVVVNDLARRFPRVPAGPWPDPPNTAIVIPIPSNKAREPAGVMVLGVSAQLKFDRYYQDFFDLIRTHVATALSNARAYEDEKKRSDALAEIDRAKTAFFSNVSHEFRTPLTLMLAPLEDLLSSDGSDLSPDLRMQLQMMNRNGSRLLHLVNTLLDFARMEAGRVQASFAPTDLAAFTSELASVFRAAIESAGLVLNVRCPPLDEDVFVDRSMWEKIVLNLISNAFKFTFAGEIAVELARRGSQVELRVRDTGVGIPPQEMPKLFERFHRIENIRSRTHEGTGIGLALVQELAKLHGGTVRADSVLGQGTTFLVSLPFGAAHLPGDRINPRPSLPSTALGAAPFVDEAMRWLPGESTSHALTVRQREASTEPSGVSGSNPAERAYILIADDNPDMRQYIIRLLSADYDVDAAADGEEALAAVQKRRPDLLLSDVMMPRLDGFGLLRQLRANELTRTIPVILLSARAGEESRVEGWGKGADDYLIKPFSARELLARIGSHLKLSAMRKKAEIAIEERERELEKIIGLTPFMMTRCSRDFRYLFASEAYARMTGLSTSEIRGRPIVEVMGQCGFETILPYAHRVLAGEVVRYESAVEFKSAGRRELSVVYTPDRNADGDVVGWVASILDITGQKKTEQALRKAHAQLSSRAVHLEALVEQRTARLRETIGELEAFSYSIAHDMRAPLRSLQGFAQFLADEYADKIDARGKDYLRRISSSANRMDRLIFDVLNYSQTMRDELPLGPVNVQRLLEGIIETYPPLQPDKATVQVIGPLPDVIGNEAALTQCFSNLLGNAVKFVAPGTRPHVRVWAETTSGRVRVSIQDNGIGIARDHHERIFAIFYRVSRAYDGTGIGLAIVKKATERMGGRVGLTSEPEGGSTFWLEMNGPAAAHST